ncbi:MAG: NTP transferase domain-containing protein [Acetivibrio sp.]
MNTGAVIIATDWQDEVPGILPLLPLGGVTLLHRLIIRLKQVDISQIVVITQKDAQEIERHVIRMGVAVLRKEEYQKSGIQDDLEIGMMFLQNFCDRVLILDVRYPLVTPNILETILKSGSNAVAMHDKKKGFPLLLYSQEKLSFPICMEKISGCEIQSGESFLKVDSQKTYQAALRQTEAEKIELRYVAQVKIGRNEIFFGPGMYQLLRMIQQSNSMLMACKMMSISYTKALKMIHRAEKELGVELLYHQTGGMQGGYSKLTQQGEKFLTQYEQLDIELGKTAKKLFQKYMLDIN